MGCSLLAATQVLLCDLVIHFPIAYRGSVSKSMPRSLQTATRSRWLPSRLLPWRVSFSSCGAAPSNHAKGFGQRRAALIANLAVAETEVDQHPVDRESALPIALAPSAPR